MTVEACRAGRATFNIARQKVDSAASETDGTRLVGRPIIPPFAVCVNSPRTYGAHLWRPGYRGQTARALRVAAPLGDEQLYRRVARRLRSDRRSSKSTPGELLNAPERRRPLCHWA